MNRPLVKCPKCKGGGKIDLSERLLPVFLMISRNPNSTPQELYDALKMQSSNFSPTAIHSLIRGLERFGLLTRTRDKAAWRYSIK